MFHGQGVEQIHIRLLDPQPLDNGFLCGRKSDHWIDYGGETYVARCDLGEHIMIPVTSIQNIYLPQKKLRHSTWDYDCWFENLEEQEEE